MSVVSPDQLRRPHVIIALAVALVLCLFWWRSCSRKDRIMAHEDWVVIDLAMLTQNVCTHVQLNGGGYINPLLLAEPDYHPTWTLATRFGEPVRYGYRFEFSGQRATPRVEEAYPHKPAYASFSYVALPVIPNKTGRRSFAIFPKNDSFAIHYREDGAPPTLADPSIKISEILGRIPPEPFLFPPNLQD
jgi:hypothetical protein